MTNNSQKIARINRTAAMLREMNEQLQKYSEELEADEAEDNYRWTSQKRATVKHQSIILGHELVDLVKDLYGE